VPCRQKFLDPLVKSRSSGWHHRLGSTGCTKGHPPTGGARGNQRARL